MTAGFGISPSKTEIILNWLYLLITPCSRMAFFSLILRIMKTNIQNIVIFLNKVIIINLE